MTMRIFVPRDAAAIAVGADEVATALEQAAETRGLADPDRPHRIARPVLAGAAGRGRDPERPRRLRPGRARQMSHGLLDAMAAATANIRSRSARR